MNKTYQEKKINDIITLLENLLSSIYGLHVLLDNCDDGEEESIKKEIDNSYRKFNMLFKDLYFTVLAYLEKYGSNEIFKLHKMDLPTVLNKDFNSIETADIDEIEETIYVSPYLQKIRTLLAPFQAFDVDVNKNVGLVYLENILHNTAVVIKNLGIHPNSETQVYNAVKFVVQATFPDWINASPEPFIKTAKCYKPDILIPSINTAVEYKFAQDAKTLVKTIEEILIDVVGYSGHHIYKTFYAVFYVKAGICDENRFNIIWNENRFPKNWKPIFVIGN